MTTRREFLVLGAASFAVPTAAKAQLDPNLAAKRKAAYEEALGKLVGGAQVRAGKVKLQLPPLIDHGNSVPLSVAVESPMTGADHVTAIHVLSQKKPLPDVVSVHLGPRKRGEARSSRSRRSPRTRWRRASAARRPAS